MPMTENPENRMLDGVTILEIEGLGPGPFAAMMLADLGARVICVQRPGPPPPGFPERSLLDRGKETIALDLKSDTDCAIVHALIQRADALIEGFRPGVMERLGLGPEQAHQINPKLVYGRMTGWGQTGPRAQTAGHDLNYIALSGALWYGSLPGSEPLTPPTLVGDIGGGALYLVAGILAGIINAARTGRGTVVDAAIVDGSAHMMGILMALWSSGAFRPLRGTSLLDGPHWSSTYQCSDLGYVTVQALEPQFYAEFLRKMGLTDDPDFAEQMNPRLWNAASATLAKRFNSRPLAYWTALFDGSDACVAPVYPPDQSATDPHMAARGTWTTAHGMLQPRPAPRFDGHALDPAAPPARDQHRGQILHWLGQ